MPSDLANILALALEIYLLLGAVFAVWFAASGCRRLDPVAASGTWGFRVLIVPGAVLLWPLLLPRAAAAGRGDA